MSERALGSRTIILYGESGLGKTTNAVYFARYMYEKHRRRLLLVSAESSSRQTFEPLIRSGVVIPFWMNVALCMSCMRKFRKGLWPSRNADGLLQWSAIDWTKPDAPCGYIFEGLTSISELALEQGRQDGRLMREQRSDAWDEEGEHFVNASQSLYGAVQDEMLFALRDIDALPIERALWTAHEYKGEEQDTGYKILGPGLVGKKKTTLVQKYAELLLHMDGYPMRVVVKDKKTGEELPVERIRRRVWWQKHPDPMTGVLYPAKVTVPSERLQELYDEFPGGYFEPGLKSGTGIDRFLDVESRLAATSVEDTQAWKESIDNGRTRSQQAVGAGSGDGSQADK